MTLMERPSVLFDEALKARLGNLFSKHFWTYLSLFIQTAINKSRGQGRTAERGLVFFKLTN